MRFDTPGIRDRRTIHMTPKEPIMDQVPLEIRVAAVELLRHAPLERVLADLDGAQAMALAAGPPPAHGAAITAGYDLLRRALRELSAFVDQTAEPTLLAVSRDETIHPRNDDGRYIRR